MSILPERARPAPCPAPASAASNPEPGGYHPGLHRLAGLMLAVAAAGASAFGPSLPPIPPPISAPPGVPSPPTPQPPFGDLQVTLNGPTEGGQWYGQVHSTSVLPAIGCGSGGACRQTYPHGLPVGLVANPVAGAIFDGWSGSCSGQASSCGVTITGGNRGDSIR